MTRNEICPNCRSTYEIEGKLDFNANAIVSVSCPVCTQVNWIPSGFPFPQNWKATGKVINRQPVTSPPIRFEDPKDNKPNYAEWSLLGEAGKVGDNILGGIKAVGTWTIIIGVIVVLVVYKEEVKDVIKAVKQ